MEKGSRLAETLPQEETNAVTSFKFLKNCDSIFHMHSSIKNKKALSIAELART